MMMDDNTGDFDRLLQPVAAQDAADRLHAQHAQRPAYSWLEVHGELIAALLGAAACGFAFALVVVGMVMA